MIFDFKRTRSTVIFLRSFRAAIFTVYLLVSGSAFAGGQDVSAGNAFEASFVTLGQVLVKQLFVTPYDVAGIDLEKLEETVKAVRVTSTPRLPQENGTETFAVHNTKEKTIVFSEYAWTTLPRHERKLRVLHEYLVHAGVADLRFVDSKRVLAQIKPSMIRPMTNDIFREVILSEPVTLSTKTGIKKALVDGFEQTIQLQRSSQKGPVRLGLPYPMPSTGKNTTVWFSSKSSEENYEPEEIESRDRCLQLLRRGLPVSKFRLSEANLSVLACWGPKDFPPPDLSPSGRFKALAKILAGKMAEYDNYLKDADLKKYLEAVENVQVIETNEPVKTADGKERHAVNSLANRAIYLNVPHWNSLTREEKEVLVIHEYLRFTGLDDSSYVLSSELAVLQNMTLLVLEKGTNRHTLKFLTPAPFKDLSTWSQSDILFDNHSDRIFRISGENPVQMFQFMKVFPDPVHGGLSVYFTLDKNPRAYSRQEWPKVKACIHKMQSGKLITTMIIGERKQNILECW